MKSRKTILKLTSLIDCKTARSNETNVFHSVCVH